MRSPSRHGRHAPASAGGWISLLAAFSALLLLCVGGCDDPQAPRSNPADYAGRFDPGAGALEFRLENVSGLLLVAHDVRFEAQERRVHAQVSIRNDGQGAIPGPDGVEVWGFTPRQVWPVNASCEPPLPPDATPPQAACRFDYRGTYGEDDALSPGEASAPVEWIFADSTGESFAFHARLLRGPVTEDGIIAGSVFADRNGDGRRQEGEPGIEGALVHLQRDSLQAETRTQAGGGFRFAVTEPGLYRVWRAAETDCKPTTPLQLEVLIVRRPDGTLSGFRGAQFGCRAGGPPAGIPVRGTVFLDANRNGSRDPGEPGVPGLRISGTTLHCPTFAAIFAVTDQRGHYELFLPDCEPPYVIARVPVPGLEDTTPNPVVFEQGPDPTAVFHADFGVARAGGPGDVLVQGTVFADLNGDGRRQDEEPGLPFVGVTVGSRICDAMPFRTMTDWLGRYLARRDQVPCAETPLTVQRDAVLGYRGTTPNAVNLEPPAPATGFQVDFGLAPRDTSCIRSQDDLVQALARAYRTRGYDTFARLPSGFPGAEYLFILNEPDPDTGETNWGLVEELRIHRRMFHPEVVPPGDSPVPPELWLASIDLTLTRQGAWMERPDLYRSSSNPAGLDPVRWEATEAVYGTHVLFDTQGDLDYRVDGKADFIVIEDLTKQVCDAGKFLLYRWEDLGNSVPALELATGGARGALEEVTWGRVKRLYK